jgi:hypothetical protein
MVIIMAVDAPKLPNDYLIMMQLCFYITIIFPLVLILTLWLDRKKIRGKRSPITRFLMWAVPSIIATAAISLFAYAMTIV